MVEVVTSRYRAPQRVDVKHDLPHPCSRGSKVPKPTEHRTLGREEFAARCRAPELQSPLCGRRGQRHGQRLSKRLKLAFMALGCDKRQLRRHMQRRGTNSTWASATLGSSGVKAEARSGTIYRAISIPTWRARVGHMRPLLRITNGIKETGRWKHAPGWKCSLGNAACPAGSTLCHFVSWRRERYRPR